MAAPTVGTPTSTLRASESSLPYNCTVAKPSGVSEGDWLIAVNNSGASQDRWFNPPSGWTTLATAVVTFGAATPSYLRIYIKKATASEPSSYDFAANTSFAVGRVTIIPVFGAADHGDEPFIAVIEDRNGSAGSTTSPSINPSVSDSLIIRCFLHSRPSGDVTSVSDNTKISTFGTGGHWASFYEQVASSATGTKSASYTPTWHEGVTHAVIAIAPASAPPTGDTRRFLVT